MGGGGGGGSRCAVRRGRVGGKVRGGRFQMQGGGDGDGDDFIGVLGKNGGKLADAFGVAAPAKADKKLAVDAKGVAAFKSAGKRNVLELSKRGERLSERPRFAAARRRSERQDQRQFIEEDGGVVGGH